MTPDQEITANEIFLERSGIAEYDGLLTRDEAERLGLLESERYRQDCEVRYVFTLPFEERRGYLEKVEKARGKKHTDILKELIQKEWFRRRKKGK